MSTPKRVIFKYYLNDAQDTLILPESHRFLKVDMQNGKITFWASVLLGGPDRAYKVTVIGTGQEFVGELPRHLGTVFDGFFVWHVFGDLK